MIRSYRQIKEAITNTNRVVEIMSKHMPTDFVDEYKKEAAEDLKKDCREFYKYVCKWHNDPLSVPLRNKDHWRTVSTDNGENCTDFIILPDNGQTDEDIEDFVHCSVYCPRYSYDFATGRVITLSWHFKRTTYGIIIIHERGIDW